MSKYHKRDTNKYPNILGCHIMYRTNIRLYSDATYLPNKYPNIIVRRKWHKFNLESLFFIKKRWANIRIRFWANFQINLKFYEFTNKYLNVFSCSKIYDWISKYICTGEMAQIRIRFIFEGHYNWIFKYSNICAHHW